MEKIDSYALGFLLNRAMWSLIKCLNSAFKERGVDLPHSQYIIMRCLFLNVKMSQQDIASLLCKDTAAIKRSVDYLERKGLVERKPISKSKYNICLTDKGRELEPVIREIVDYAFKELFSNISEETYQGGIKFLRAIYESYTKETPDKYW